MNSVDHRTKITEQQKAAAMAKLPSLLESIADHYDHIGHPWPAADLRAAAEAIDQERPDAAFLLLVAMNSRRYACNSVMDSFESAFCDDRGFWKG